jgi:hypothetical protein
MLWILFLFWLDGMTKISSFFRDETWPTGLVTVLESSRARDRSCSWASFHEDKYFWSSFFGQRFIRMFRVKNTKLHAPPQDAMLHCIQCSLHSLFRAISSVRLAVSWYDAWTLRRHPSGVFFFNLHYDTSSFWNAPHWQSIHATSCLR